jgi:hypothetical protein
VPDIFVWFELAQPILMKAPKVKFHENPSSRSCAVPSTWAAGWTF